MKFEFSIRQTLKESWEIFADHPGFFVLLSLVMLVLNIVSRFNSWIITILVGIASVIWSYIMLSGVLAAVDGKEELVKLNAIEKHLPTMTQFWKLVLVGIASGIIIIAGFILLIIPGVYFLTRLVFSNISLVDRQGSVKQSLKYSWYLVKKDVFWTVFVTLVCALIIVIVGILVFGIGFLVAYPLALIMLTKLYRALGKHRPIQEVIVQPTEIPAHTE